MHSLLLQSFCQSPETYAYPIHGLTATGKLQSWRGSEISFYDLFTLQLWISNTSQNSNDFFGVTVTRHRTQRDDLSNFFSHKPEQKNITQKKTFCAPAPHCRGWRVRTDWRHEHCAPPSWMSTTQTSKHHFWQNFHPGSLKTKSSRVNVK